MTKFLALVEILSPIEGGGQQPPQVNWPTFPSNPIAGGGGGGQQPPYPSQGPGFPSHPAAPGGGGGSPSHPIAIPLPPPGINIPVFPGQLPMPGGGNEKPDQSLPTDQPGVSNPISGGFILVFHPQYGWILVAQGGGMSEGPGSEKPNQDLPGQQPGISNELPDDQPKPEQGLPPHAQPKPAPKKS